MINQRPVVLCCARYFIPAFRAGGPIKSVARIVSSLGDDFDFRVICLDRDIGDKVPFPNLPADGWVQHPGARVKYLRAGQAGPRAVQAVIEEIKPDCLYVNSFFDRQFSWAPQFAWRNAGLDRRRVVIAPRGEFSQGALHFKTFRKWSAIEAFKLLRLHRDCLFHATSATEDAEIAKVFPTAKRRKAYVLVAQSPGALDASPPPQGRPLRIVFLSRIHPKKNLDYALTTLRQVTTPCEFLVVGPSADADYTANCRRMAAALPAHIKVAFRGEVLPAQIQTVLRPNDLFLLPTRGENFGHVIIEALQAALPILISDQTPFRNLQDRGAGWDLPLDDPAAFAQTIDTFAALPWPQRVAMKRNALQLAQEVADDSRSLGDHRALFHEACSGEVVRARA